MMIKSKLNLKSGIRLREIIREKGITQAQLADLTGFTQQYISNIITGKKPMSINAAEVFSNCLNIRREYLLCEDDFKTWEELERTRNEVSNDECQIAINYLRTLGVSITPLIATPVLTEKGAIKQSSLAEEHGSNIVDQNGNEYILYKVPQLTSLLHKDSESLALNCMALSGFGYVSIETTDSHFVLSLKEFTFFLNNIDDFVKFSISNFFNNHSYIKGFYTSQPIKSGFGNENSEDDIEEDNNVVEN